MIYRKDKAGETGTKAKDPGTSKRAAREKKTDRPVAQSDDGSDDGAKDAAARQDV